MKISIREDPFDPWEEIGQYQDRLAEESGKYGATASFVGTMRDLNEGDSITKMTLEHYPGMTEQYLQKIIQTAEVRWNFRDVLVIHRVGDVFPNDPIVLVSVWSSHRGDAFDVCRFIMEELKSKVPFWKKEALVDRERWVQENSDGYAGHRKVGL